MRLRLCLDFLSVFAGWGLAFLLLFLGIFCLKVVLQRIGLGIVRVSFDRLLINIGSDEYLLDWFILNFNLNSICP